MNIKQESCYKCGVAIDLDRFKEIEHGKGLGKLQFYKSYDGQEYTYTLICPCCKEKIRIIRG